MVNGGLQPTLNGLHASLGLGYQPKHAEAREDKEFSKHDVHNEHQKMPERQAASYNENYRDHLSDAPFLFFEECVIYSLFSSHCHSKVIS